MGRITRAAALVAVVFASMASGPAAQAPELALGMIRPDGILTPFAVFDGKTWTAAWPKPQQTRTIDGMLERVDSYWRAHQQQVPRAWHIPRPGEPALEVKSLKYVIFEEHCENQVGLLTDMAPRRQVDSIPYARMLATDRPIAVEAPGPPVDASKGTSPEGRATLRPLGTLKVGGSTFRIVLEIGYEGEGMSVVQIGPDGEREVLSTHIGGC